MLPSTIQRPSWQGRIARAGLPEEYQGKVRIVYRLPGFEDYRLMMPTDQGSSHDFVYGRLFLRKGELLHAVNVHWEREVLRPSGIKTDLVAYGKAIDEFLPDVLRGDMELRARGSVVRWEEMAEFEGIGRICLTGSGYRDYVAKDGMVCGHQLPPGMHDGSLLPEPIFTPSTKAKTGHDLNVLHQMVNEKYPWMARATLDTLGLFHDYCLPRGIIVADGKNEFTINGSLADERGTPDAIRAWTVEEWKLALKENRTPVSDFDKEPFRDFSKSAISSLGMTVPEHDPSNLEHVEAVGQIFVPDAIVNALLTRYESFLVAISGCSLDEFQQRYLDIAC